MKSSEYIDITPLGKMTAEELHTAITNAVRDTQSAVLLTPLPSYLIIRTDQFELLAPSPDMQQMYGSKDFVYITELNAMEVRVKDGEAAQEYAEEHGSL